MQKKKGLKKDRTKKNTCGRKGVCKEASTEGSMFRNKNGRKTLEKKNAQKKYITKSAQK